MESARVRRVLRADRFRPLRCGRALWTDCAIANRGLDRHGKERNANRGDQSAGAELDLSPRSSRPLLTARLEGRASARPGLAEASPSGIFACRPEDFENAGVIFGAGMTWKKQGGAV